MLLAGAPGNDGQRHPLGDSLAFQHHEDGSQVDVDVPMPGHGGEVIPYRSVHGI